MIKNKKDNKNNPGRFNILFNFSIYVEKWPNILFSVFKTKILQVSSAIFQHIFLKPISSKSPWQKKGT